MPSERSPEAQLALLGLALPKVPRPVGVFCPGRIENGLLYLSGQGPLLEDGQLATGKVGRDVSVQAARHHAMRAGLVIISAIRDVIGDLDRVSNVVKLLGFVNATEDFDRHPEVIDGCSELFHSVFRERGSHARSAIGVHSLPGRITVEIEAIVSIRV